jgi:hypothetical protein
VIATGSGLERFISCRASTVLPRVWAETSEHAARGTELHAHLERISNGTDPAESLEMVDARYREACAAVDLDAIADDLALSPEVTLVYNPFTDTARVLGQGLERDYSGVSDDEVPMTLDLVGVDLEAARGAVSDWKSGWATLAPTRRNWQMVGGSLALARAFDLDEVDAQLIYVREGVSIRRDQATFEAADLAAAAGEVKIAANRAAADRARAARGEHVEPTEGSWCKYCPSQWSCPAKVGLIRAAISPEGIPEGRVMPLTREKAVEAWHALKRAKPLMKQLETAIMALAAITPLHLETTPEGVEVWLGNTETKGNEKLDPAIAIEVAAEVLYADEAERASEMAALQVELADFDVTKKRLDAAIKARVPRGKGAETARVILEEVRRRGGASRSEGEAVKVYTRKPAAEQAA